MASASGMADASAKATVATDAQRRAGETQNASGTLEDARALSRRLMKRASKFLSATNRLSIPK